MSVRQMADKREHHYFLTAGFHPNTQFLCAECGTKALCAFCTAPPEQSFVPGVLLQCAVCLGSTVVVGRTFLKEQATILFRFAKTVSDPTLSAALIEKAAEIKDRADVAVDLEPHQDRSLKAPDVEFRDNGSN